MGVGNATKGLVIDMADEQVQAQTAAPDEGMAGEWLIILKMPMGTQKIPASYTMDGSTMTGTMKFMGKVVEVEDGVATTEGFSCKLHVKMLGQELEADVDGVRDGDTTSGTVTTKMGTLDYEGPRK